MEDDPSILFGIRSFLTSKGYRVETAETAVAAQRLLERVLPDAAIVDYELPDGTALTLLPRLESQAPDCPVLVLTGHASIELAVRAMQAGAENFLTKPIELPALQLVLERSIESRRARRHHRVDRARQSQALLDPFVGSSAAIRDLAVEARRALRSGSPILIEGPTGSGKGVLARWLHRAGPRAEEPFLELNCASLAPELLDSELFGHEKGAFTGAIAAKPGLLESAHRGIVFLDELGDMDLAVQAKLLKVLEDRRFRRVGGLQDRQVDILLIAATHADLLERVRERRFREDLYYRVGVIPLHVPPLRSRTEDIPALARTILERLGAELGRPAPSLTGDAIAALRRYEWPGNVRELRNVLERALLRTDAATLEASALAFETIRSRGEAPQADGDDSLAAIERRHIERVLLAEDGNVERAAARLGVPRSTLYQKIRTLRIRRGA